MFIGRLFDLLRETYIGWNERKAPVYAAALAYSTLFSLAPLLIVTVSLASLTVNKASIETRLLQTIETQVGEPVADLTEEILSARLPIETNSLITLFSVVLLIYAASRVFLQLRLALNAMLNIEPRPVNVRRTLLNTVKNTAVSVLAALTVGLAPILLLFATTLAASLPHEDLAGYLGLGWLTTLIDVFSSPVAYFVFFGIVYRLLPQARVPWRSIWPGALLAAGLYWIGGWFLGWYLRNPGYSSLYGAAGSVIVLLLWAYYTAWILLYGMRFIYVVAATRGHAIRPHRDTIFADLVYRED
ncbi:MAG: YihY/virulence factor BrkB family protein [Caldilineaceae bacterium]|nr:YihY/virulence factor BrkB family protein [Caldilineaceae bacterium]MBP8293118.1 YihY/virulence factor BrkB family protein [Caldilineaceae bacterium]